MTATPLVITSDNELFKHLQLSDADVAMFLGRSRAAIKGDFGPGKNAASASNNYFKTIDILDLVSGALELEKAFDAAAVRHYIAETRESDVGTPPYVRVMEMLHRVEETPIIDLKRDEEIDFQHANTVVFILPGFSGRPQSYRDTAITNFCAVAGGLLEGESEPNMFVVSFDQELAKVVGEALGVLKQDGSNCLGRDMAQSHHPTVLVYRSDADELCCYTLTNEGTFSEQILHDAGVNTWRVRLPLEIGRAMQPSLTAQRDDRSSLPGLRRPANPNGPTG